MAELLSPDPVWTCCVCGKKGSWPEFGFPLTHPDYPEWRHACPEHEAQVRKESNEAWADFARYNFDEEDDDD